MLRILTVFVLIAIAAAPADASGRWIVDRWGTEQGLPNNALTAIIQTADGYLWVATWAGVMRFDGVRFTPVADDLQTQHIRALIEDADGAVWIGTGGGGLARWRNGAAQVIAGDLTGSDVFMLARDGDGQLWVGTENAVGVVHDGHVKLLPASDRPAPRGTGILAPGRNGQIWLAYTATLCEGRGARLTCGDAPFVTAQPTALLEDRQGRLWIGTSRGLVAHGAEMLDESRCVGRDCVFTASITALLESDDGAIWVGLASGAVVRLQGDDLERWGTAEGLPAGPVVALHEDDEGSLWIGTVNGGLTRLRRARVHTYAEADGLPAPVVGSIVQDGAGTIYAGAQCGHVSELRGGRFVPRFTEHLQDACAWVLWPARDGSLWIGTADRGIFRWTGSRMEHFGREQGLSDVTVRGVFEDRDGVIWIGTELGGVHRYEHGRLSRAYGAADGVATYLLASFAQDRDGRVWLGSNGNGLSVYESGRFRMLTPEESPPTGDISGLLVDSRGDLWIGSAADGLFRRRNGRYEPFGVAEGLGDRLVALLLEDRDGHLWVGTSRGIARLDRQQIDEVASGRRARLEPLVVDRTDGMRYPEGSGGGFHPSGLVDQDGRLWFSTIDGIVVIDPSTFTINRLPPKLLVESATLGNHTVPLQGESSIIVPPGTTPIEIAYTAFSFAAPLKTRFRYRLNGFDEDWQDVGARRTAYYSRLPPGAYRFEMIAANNDGVWNLDPAIVTLVVQPFFWEQRWVRGAAVGLLLAATGLVVFAWSQRRARRRVEDLERTQALERERTRIARDLHDDLGSRLTHIALVAEQAGTGERGPRLALAAREAVQALDELVWTVNARQDTVEGFAVYANRFVEEHVGTAGLRYRVHLEPDLDRYALHAQTRRHLYLAMKEAVNNAIKHAAASEIRLRVSVDRDTLRLEVTDDGRGLPPGGGDPTGHGLSTMRERMDAVRGRLSVESAPARGTRVVFDVPLAGA